MGCLVGNPYVNDIESLSGRMHGLIIHPFLIKAALHVGRATHLPISFSSE
jgi:hypothetical protein